MERQILSLIICTGFLLTPFSTFAAPPFSPYLPGETMAPTCAPGDVYCTVSTTTPYYNQTTNTIDVDNLAVKNATTTELWVGSLTGILRAIGGHVLTGLVNLASEVTGILPISYGGTGTSTQPSLGNLLIGNSFGGYNFIATSSLGLPSFLDLHDAVTITGQDYLTLTDQNISVGPINLSGSNATGTLASSLLSGTYSGQLTFSNPLNNLAGIGSGLTALNANNIATGTIGTVFGGTGVSNYLAGDILVANASNTLSKLSVGPIGNILWISGQGIPSWTGISSLGLSFNDLGGTASLLQIPNNLDIDGGSIENTPIGLGDPDIALFTGVTTGSATTTSAHIGNLVVTGTATTSVLNISNTLSLGTSTGILKSVGGAVSAVASSAVSLASDVSGVLSPSRGGTGLVNIQAGAVLYGNGTGALATTSIGTNGQVLAYVGGLPVWVATTTFSGALSYSGGNVTINNGSIANSLLANAGIDVAAGAGLSGGGVTALGSTATLSLNTGNSNYWTGLQSFAQASTSLLSVRGAASFGTTATSSFDNSGRLTLANAGASALLSIDSTGLVVASTTPVVTAIIASSTSATSTLAGGLTVGNNKLVVDRVTGNVGIGGLPGATALAVAGKVSASLGFNGTCYSGLSILGFTLLGCNQDVAEVYSAYELTEPGDIVALPKEGDQQFDESAVAKVGRATGSVRETLLGVVSLNPGLVFNNGHTYLAGANDELVTNQSTVVALAGRVPVKVSIENGPIKAGDKLTVSTTTPGVAVRAINPGMVIGTALQPYDGNAEINMVLMFVDLHWYPGEEEEHTDSFTKAVRWSLDRIGMGVTFLARLSADRVETKELCVDGVCINGEQLRSLLQKSTVEPVVEEPDPVPEEVTNPGDENNEIIETPN